MKSQGAKIIRAEDHTNDIVLKIEGDRVDSVSFFACVNDFLGLLREVQRPRILDNEQLTWLISVDKGSCVIRATPFVSQAAMQLVAAFKDTLESGIKIIEESDARPQDFSNEAIEKLRHLASKIKVSEEGVGITRLQVGINGGSRGITSQSAVNASKLLMVPKQAHGSISGRLDVIQGRKGLFFYITNENRHIKVKCVFEEDLLDTVLRAFRKRVSAYGKITYDSTHRPVQLVIESLRELEEDDKLPQMYDVLGVLNA